MSNTAEVKEIKTIVQLAQEMSNCFEWKERTDGTPYVILNEDKRQPWMFDLIKEVHGDSLPDDTIYEFIEDAIDNIADMEIEADILDVQEGLYERLQADVYTSDLTEWLNRRADHVFYLTEALENYNPKDGFEALSIAQYLMKEEIAIATANKLEEIANQ